MIEGSSLFYFASSISRYFNEVLKKEALMSNEALANLT